MPRYRVEATVPAIQTVTAASAAEARELACEQPDQWDVDLDAEISDDHVVDVVLDSDDDETDE